MIAVLAMGMIELANAGDASLSDTFSPYTDLTIEQIQIDGDPRYISYTPFSEEDRSADATSPSGAGGSGGFYEPFDGSTIPPNWLVVYGAWAVG